MADKYESVAGRDGVTAPAYSAFAVSKSDGTTFAQPTRGLWVGGAGDVAVRMIDGTTVTFTNVPAGCCLPIRVDKVLSTGTDATDIVGLY